MRLPTLPRHLGQGPDLRHIWACRRTKHDFDCLQHEDAALAAWLPAWWGMAGSQWQEFPANAENPHEPFHGQDEEDRHLLGERSATVRMPSCKIPRKRCSPGHALSLMSQAFLELCETDHVASQLAYLSYVGRAGARGQIQF